jgi:Glycogen recognition site of AMP-activated protein kinase
MTGGAPCGRRLSTVLGVAASVCISGPAAGQRWQVDIGGNSVGYDTAGTVRSASISPLFEWNRRILYSTVSGAVAAFEGGEWTTQGHGDLSLLFGPASGATPLRAEVLGSLDGSAHSSGYRTAATRAEMRFHAAGRSAGVWVGGTGATGWTSNSTGVATALGPTVGVWGRHQAWIFTAVWNPYRLEGYWFSELQARASTSLGPVDLLGYVGCRGSPTASAIPNSTWGGGTLAVWLTPQTALVLGGGNYPLDLLQALPKGRYVSAAIRLSRGRPAIWAAPSTGHALYAQARGERELQFTVAGASRVDVVGDWTGWQPIPLRRGPSGRWILRADLTPGVHRFNLVVDGERWIVPEGSAAVDDGFGGKTSLLIVS